MIDSAPSAPSGTSAWVPYVGAGTYSVRGHRLRHAARRDRGGSRRQAGGDRDRHLAAAVQATPASRGSRDDRTNEAEAGAADGHGGSRATPTAPPDVDTGAADAAFVRARPGARATGARDDAPAPETTTPDPADRHHRTGRGRPGRRRQAGRRAAAAARPAATPHRPTPPLAEGPARRLLTLRPARPRATIGACLPPPLDALSDAAREFVDGPAPPADRRRAGRRRRRAHVRDDRPGHRRADLRGRPGRRRGRRAAPSRPPAPRSRAPLRKVSPSKRAGLMYTLAELIKANGDRARRARVARQRQAARRRRRRHRRLGRPPALLRGLADEDRGRDVPGLGAATCSSTRCASRSASAPRSCPGTSRC